jgi:hypothetical protein
MESGPAAGTAAGYGPFRRGECARNFVRVSSRAAADSPFGGFSGAYSELRGWSDPLLKLSLIDAAGKQQAGTICFEGGNEIIRRQHAVRFAVPIQVDSAVADWIGLAAQRAI